MNVAQIAERVKHQFGDISGVQITDANIITWINDAQRELVKQNEELLQVSSTANLVAQQQNYSIPTDQLIIRSVYCKYSGETRYFKLKGLEFEQFEEQINGWEGDTYGRPIWFTVYGSNFILFPAPDVAVTAGLKIYYNRKPVDVDSNDDIPELPELYHAAIVNYCLIIAHQVDENVELAGMKASEFSADTTLLRGRAGWKNQDYYPTITTRIEDM